jgi:hypothetical protein
MTSSFLAWVSKGESFGKSRGLHQSNEIEGDVDTGTGFRTVGMSLGCYTENDIGLVAGQKRPTSSRVRHDVEDMLVFMEKRSGLPVRVEHDDRIPVLVAVCGSVETSQRHDHDGSVWKCLAARQEDEEDEHRRSLLGITEKHASPGPSEQEQNPA